MDSISSKAIWTDLERIRQQGPLIHNITNYVVMNFTANALLAIGASPVMAHAAEEVSEMAAASRGLVINLGTLSGPWVESMRRAMQSARAAGVPIVMDPVGSGATAYRTVTAKHLMQEFRPEVIRGNVSEILSLAGLKPDSTSTTKGVDSTERLNGIDSRIENFAQASRCTLGISGAVDFVVGPSARCALSNGHRLMTQVTGMGCTSTALIGAFLAVNPSPFEAAAHAMALMGIAGEIAAERSTGPGTFPAVFLDVLSRMDMPTLEARLRVTRA